MDSLTRGGIPKIAQLAIEVSACRQVMLVAAE